jgi:hypothetical protein
MTDMQDGDVLPDLTDEEKAAQRAALDLAVRMGVGAASFVKMWSPAGYFNLAPATRTRAEVHRALAFLLSRGLITVNTQAFERWFSIDYEVPEHLRDDEYLDNAFARGF